MSETVDGRGFGYVAERLRTGKGGVELSAVLNHLRTPAPGRRENLVRGAKRL
jgi:hypothetical protein